MDAVSPVRDPRTSTPIEELHDDPNFRANDADVCILSSDHVRFKLHSANLRVVSSIFPAPPATSQCDDPIYLDEPAAVLRILLAYIYPDPPHPELEDLEFPLLYDVAVAADKYQFMMLVYLCELVLEKHSAKHPFKILRYTVLRGNKRAMDRVAPATLKFGLGTCIQELQGDVELFRRWIVYREAVYASTQDYFSAPSSSSGGPSEITQRLQYAVSEDRFDSSILFSATKDIDSWLQTLWGKRI